MLRGANRSLRHFSSVTGRLKNNYPSSQVGKEKINKDCPAAGKEMITKRQTHKQLRRSPQIFFSQKVIFQYRKIAIGLEGSESAWFP